MKAGHDRDRMLDTALKHAFVAQADGAASDACLDAETLAAWMDSGLDPPEVALAEAHVSSCARCQMLVASMVRTASAVPVGGTSRTAFWRWWLAPVAAAAAAATLWIVVPEDQSTPAPPAPAENAVEAQPDGSVAKREYPARLQPPPPPRGAQPATEEARSRDAVADSLLGRDASKRAEATSSDAAAPARSAAGQARSTAPHNSAAFGSDLPRDVTSPDPAVRWRIGARGAVNYTADGGRTWETVATGVTTEIVAGSSPSPAVCWLVGHGGVVLVSTDGRRFLRVAPPVNADLVSVQAVDASAAVITAVDGRAFRTDDGGLTWRSRD